jgi:hypothetical protein
VSELNCECIHWAHTGQSPYKITSRDGIPLMPNHHPNCSHYNDSLMTVYRHSQEGKNGCYFENLTNALESAKSEFEWGDSQKAVVTREKMHREVFENLPDFEGF